MVEEIIGRLPELTGAQLGRLEDEIRRERQRRASSPTGGGQDASHVQEDAVLPVTEVLEYRPTRTAICNWSYAATSVVTAHPASVDPTGTSSTTRGVSVRSSTSARPTTQSVLWPPSGQCCSVLSLLLSEPLEVLDCSVRQWAYIPKC